VAGRAIRQLRSQQGWTVAQLAAAAQAAGGELITEAVINKLEQGKRDDIPVSTVLVLAMALKVSPLVLILPADEAEPVQITPDLTVSAQAAYEWWVGGRTSPNPASMAGGAWDDVYQAQAALRDRLPYTRTHADRIAMMNLNREQLNRMFDQNTQGKGENDGDL
jgi:transcriptional regulator with XRE-family HTH domain